MDSGAAITLADVARTAGVSTFTASQALRDKPGVSKASREKVLQVAQQLGYRRNYPASMLAQQRRSRPLTERIAIAALGQNDDGRVFLTHAAQELNVEMHFVSESSFASPQAASRILWHRGVSGILIGYQHLEWSEAERAQFDWARFAVIKMTRGKPDIPCHLVRHSAYDYMAHTLREVIGRGYRRIAILTGATESPDDDGARYGAIANCRDRLVPEGTTLHYQEIPWNRYDLPPNTAQWLRERRPDAVVVFQNWWIWALRNSGFRIPEDFAIAAVLSPDDRRINPEQVSGCDPRSIENYQRALTLLLDLIGRSETGFPSRVLEHVVEPIWYEGITLPHKG